MLAMSPTVYHVSIPTMPYLSFSIDSRTMLITCEDGQQFNSPSWWRAVRNNGNHTWSIHNFPLTQDDIQRLDFNHMRCPDRDEYSFRVFIRYGNQNHHEPRFIHFKKVGSARKLSSRKN